MGLYPFRPLSVPPIAHATTHEDGQADEINVDGLAGDLADAQDPKTHAATHATGQADALAITAIGGDAAGTARPPTNHAANHISGGDPITVGDLGGDAAGTARPPTAHAGSHATGQSDAMSVTDIGGDAAGTARPPTTNVKAKTFADTGYNAIVDDSLYVDASGGVTSIVLPTAVAGNKGRRIQIKKTDSSVNNVSVTVNGGGNIDGSATFAWNSQYASYTFESDGIQWWLV